MTLLADALDYLQRGLSIIPIRPGSKSSACAWKRFQSQRADETQAREWFRGDNGLAIVCGAVSGNLVVRDFDVDGAYEAWRGRCPDLAERLPTVQTARGYHLYARSENPINLRMLQDGELRGEGGYVLAPRTVHPDGPVYRWIKPIGADGIPVLNESDCGQLLSTHCTESVELLEVIDEGVGIRGTLSDMPSIQRITPEILEVILSTLPTGPRQRNKCILRAARGVKFNPSIGPLSSDSITMIAKEWHKLALPFIETKTFSETLWDFRRAYKVAAWPVGEGVLSMVAVAIKEQTPPKIIVERYGDYPEFGKIACLCRELQRRSGKSAFFLGCRDAAKLAGISWRGALSVLKELEELGLLSVVKQGVRGKPQATRYRYHEVNK